MSKIFTYLSKPEWFFIRLLASILICFLFFSFYNSFFLFFKTKESENLKNVNLDLVIATPTKLFIPSLGLNAQIIPVGKTRSGNLDVPKSLKNVGWYNLGVRPGEIGNAVIDGHEVDRLGFGAVFKNLHLLKAGDKIIVEGEDNKKIEFVVVKTEIYDYDVAPLSIIFGDSDKRNLNLITCEGDFISKIGTKNKRLVVFSAAI